MNTKEMTPPMRSHRKGIPPLTQGESSCSITHESEKIAQSKQKRDNFTQIQNCIIDSDLPESSIMGFIRFLRLYGREGMFVGSIRKLCKLLRKARATVSRMIDDWIQAGWVKQSTREKVYEEGVVMCLTLCQDDLWQENSERYMKTAEKLARALHTCGEVARFSTQEQGGSKVSQGGTEMSQHGLNVGQHGSQMNQSGQNRDQSGSPATLKTGGNIGNIDSNIDSKMEGNREDERTSEELPQLNLPSLTNPSSLLNDFSFETITSETPYCWQAIFAIGEHYLGKSKCAQSAAESLVQKTYLLGPKEARRQIITNITFMLYSDHKLNWFQGNKRKQLTLHNVAAFWDDYTRKAEEAGWIPPKDKVPSWFEVASPPTGQVNAASGLTQAEADLLIARIRREYPGMKFCSGRLPDSRFTIGIWLGEDDAWLDFWSIEDWQARSHLQPHWGWAMETYEQSRLAEVA